MGFKKTSIPNPSVKNERTELADRLTAQMQSEIEALPYSKYDFYEKYSDTIAVIKMDLNYATDLDIERTVSVFNSYSIKDTLKSNGFYYNPTDYSWVGNMNEKNIEMLKSLNVEIYKK